MEGIRDLEAGAEGPPGVMGPSVKEAGTNRKVAGASASTRRPVPGLAGLGWRGRAVWPCSASPLRRAGCGSRTAVLAPTVVDGEDALPLRQGEQLLDHEGVHVDDRSLEDVEGDHAEFLLVAPVGGELAALAVEDHRVDPVPGLDDVEALLDFTLEVAVAQVSAHEDGPLGSAEFQHGLVDGVGGVAGEAAQDGFG